MFNVVRLVFAEFYAVCDVADAVSFFFFICIVFSDIISGKDLESFWNELSVPCFDIRIGVCITFFSDVNCFDIIFEWVASFWPVGFILQSWFFLWKAIEQTIKAD